MTRQELAELQAHLRHIARSLADRQRRLDDIDAMLSRLETNR